MMMRGLLFVALLSLQSLALDMGDIEIMRDSGVKIAFPNERKAHTISRSTRPADLMRVNYIKLNGQSLHKIPKWLPKMRNLVKLELQATNMDLIDLFALKSLTQLNTLDLSNNKNLFDKGGSLSELLSHFSLSELYLANTGGSSSDYANIGNSKSLIKLDLSDNTISSINALHLERLQNIKSLKIVANSISGTLDTAYLPKRSLVYLNLSSNNISRLKYSDDFPALESLHISMNDSYLEFDEDWDDAYILKELSDGSFNKDVALPRSIMERLGIDPRIELYKQKIEVNPKDYISYYNMGVAYDKKEYDKAIKFYQKAIEINPQYDKAYFNIGIVYGKKEEYNKAIVSYEKAVEINPKKYEAYCNMGNIYAKKGEYYKAIVLHQKAIEINPKSYLDYVAIGNIYSNKKEYYKAIEFYQKAIEINPKDDTVYYNMGVIYDNKKEYDKAIIFFKKAIYINPSADRYGTLSWWQILNKNYKEAIISAKKGLSFDSKEKWINLNLAHAYLFDNQYNKAKDIYIQFKGQKISINHSLWELNVLKDFKELKNNNITHPNMKKIKKLLN